MKSLYSKIVLTVIGIIFFSGLLSFLLSNWYYQRNIKIVNEKKILDITTEVVSYYHAHSSLDLQGYLMNVAGLQYTITLFNEQGEKTVFGDNFKEDVISKEIVSEVLQGRVYNGIALYESGWFVTGFFKDDIQNSIGMRIQSQGQNYALFLRPNVKQQFGELHYLFAFMLGFAFLFSIFVILVCSRRIVNPIKALAKATQQVGKGDFSTFFRTKRQDEIGILFREFNQMSDSLQSLEKMRQEFVSNVSHEIRSPLTTIKGFATVLEKNETDTEKKKYLGAISQESSRISQLSEQLLLLASLDSEVKKINKEQFSLDQQIQQLLLHTEQQWSKKELDIQCDIQAMTYYGDSLLLYQVWQNFLENSIKFTPNGGKVFICLHQGKEVRFSIEDSGIGMSTDQQERMFERFYKGDEVRNRGIVGTGLGLSIVKKIIHLHHGRVKVESEVGKGTKITVYLPIEL